VDVKNTGTADEVLTLSALSDTAYGDITKLGTTAPPVVLGTTCGVAAGAGTLTGTTGAGALPQSIAVGATYSCQFDGQFCGPIATVTKPDGTACFGLQNVDKVTGTIHGDEGVTDTTVSQTGNTLTVDECFTSFTNSTTP